MGLALALVASLTACHLLPSVAQLAKGAAMVADAIDAAEAGSRVYLQRHPNLDAERSLAAAVKRARLAVSTLSAALAAGASDDAAQARLEAVRAYGSLVQLLDELGILSGRPALGGAETDAPAPGPLPLPPVGAVAAALGR